MFIKHLSELKKEVLDYNTTIGKDMQPDMFLIFLDKIRNLTHSDNLNEIILKNIADINID